ncbi:mitochondrial import inner membrane translocase subunit Tim10 B-like isoform X2 [Thrips palmi]|nr:mitochondrial import inner membrane translocase subunit Tim10 B-like isoform X2 [Thrips palmi]
MSHTCFQNCVNNFYSRDLASDEENCVDLCAKKHIKVNHKVMGVFMELQPMIINKRMEEMNQAALQIEQAAAGALPQDQVVSA